MIIIFLVCAVLCSGWLPWWTMIPLGIAFGVLGDWNWRDSAMAAFILALLQAAVCYYIDRQNHFVISQKMAAILIWPRWTIELVSPILTFWWTTFSIRLGRVGLHIFRAKYQ